MPLLMLPVFLNVSFVVLHVQRLRTARLLKARRFLFLLLLSG